jgi:hypothetical protein
VLWETSRLCRTGYECAMVPAPLDYAQADGEDIEVFVYRRLSSSKPPRVNSGCWKAARAVRAWILCPCWSMPLLTNHPDWDFYSLEPSRGGNTARLAVPRKTIPTST